MPFLTPKPKSSMAWLPSQVLYGIDTSHSDSKQWTRFGKYAEQRAAEATKHERKSEPKPSA